jgi:glycosyltransferase involved in cell wall biosynthesis
MSLEITPIVLTFNEEPNIARTLEQLRWARSVIVLDSFSTDATLELARRFDNVRVIQHRFVDFAQQWNFVLEQGGIETEWVLALDADYVLSEELVAELAELQPEADVGGYRCSFQYCIQGSPLRGSLYPPNTLLFRRRLGRYIQDGHAYRLTLATGRVVQLQGKIKHDDRKSLERWLISQEHYARIEVGKLRRTPLRALSWPDRIRRIPFAAPAIVPWYCLLIKGSALDGVSGLAYVAQRTVAELILSLMLVEERVSARQTRATSG